MLTFHNNWNEGLGRMLSSILEWVIWATGYEKKKLTEIFYKFQETVELIARSSKAEQLLNELFNIINTKYLQVSRKRYFAKVIY